MNLLITYGLETLDSQIQMIKLLIMFNYGSFIAKYAFIDFHLIQMEAFKKCIYLIFNHSKIEYLLKSIGNPSMYH